MRLNKFLAECRVASRRKADLIIKLGQVKVNGKLIKEMGVQVDPENDQVSVNGKICQYNTNKIYIALNKPTGYVCTHALFHGEQSIFKLLPNKFSNYKIAGRLDKQTEGLLILSNDGDFINQLTHPKFKHQKEYEVKLVKDLNQYSLIKLQKGVMLEEGMAKLDKIRKMKDKEYQVIIHQGWKRQIRRMFDKLHFKIISLRRIRVGEYKIGKLPAGQFKMITKQEVLNRR
ncbi:MAG: pseudouridine synthase [bacterium]|nr:pseudouridine synthase [bacterium]